MGTPITVDLNLPEDRASPRPRRKSKRVWVGGTAIGDGAPVAVQSMCTTLTHDVDATIRQIEQLQEGGCEIARVAVHYAAWASAVDAPDRAIAAAMAKAQAASAANYVTAECIQIHGGVGYTWECDAHLFLRRAKVNDLLLGYQGWQRQRVADLYFASL